MDTKCRIIQANPDLLLVLPAIAFSRIKNAEFVINLKLPVSIKYASVAFNS